MGRLMADKHQTVYDASFDYDEFCEVKLIQAKY